MRHPPLVSGPPIRRHVLDPRRRKSSIISRPLEADVFGPTGGHLHDEIEAARAFDGVPIGISDGLSEGRRLWRGRARVSGYPSLENAPGAVEMLLVPSDHKYLDGPACLATGRLRMVGLICPRNRGGTFAAPVVGH